MYYIYEIKNNINNKTYIGQHKTKNLMDSYMGSGILLHKAYKKYNVKNFSKKILAVCETQENADILEKVFIKIYREMNKAEYNICDGGNGILCSGEFEIKRRIRISDTSKGHIVSKETRKKISESNKGKKHPHTEETKKKISKASSEHWKREGFKELVGKRISESRKGKKLNKSVWNKNKHTGYHWFNNGVKNVLLKECPDGFEKGRLISDSDIQRLKTINIGRSHIVSEETKRKISESNKKNPSKAMLGRHHSEETRKKMSEKAKGKIVKDETKKKLSEYMKCMKMMTINGKRTWVKQ